MSKDISTTERKYLLYYLGSQGLYGIIWSWLLCVEKPERSNRFLYQKNSLNQRKDNKIAGDHCREKRKSERNIDQNIQYSSTTTAAGTKEVGLICVRFLFLCLSSQP